MSTPGIDIQTLTPADRLRLIEQLWDSLSDEEVTLTEAREIELDRRLDELDREGPRGIPWEDVLRRLESRS